MREGEEGGRRRRDGEGESLLQDKTITVVERGGGPPNIPYDVMRLEG